MREDMLARLIAQGSDQGADLVTLRAIVEEASELGAARTLARMGLGEPGASDDLAQLRELVRAWRDAKRSAWRVVVGWAVRGVLALVMLGLAWRSGVLR